jgi:hypothetical protein
MKTIASLVVVIAATATAHAEPRIGFELGGGMWGGHMECQSQSGSCDGISAAGGANVEARYFWRPEWGAFFDVWPMAHTENNFTITHVISTVGVQWRPAPALTFAAGVGGAHASFDYAGITVGESDSGGAVMLAASLDVFQSFRWALAVEARVGAGFYGQSQNGMADVTGRNEGLGLELSFWGF